LSIKSEQCFWTMPTPDILARTDDPLLEPEKPYEIQGQVPNVVFPCGAVVVDNIVYLYYGGADTVTCVATMPLKTLTDVLVPAEIINNYVS